MKRYTVTFKLDEIDVDFVSEKELTSEQITKKANKLLRKMIKDIAYSHEECIDTLKKLYTFSTIKGFVQEEEE